MAASKVLMVEPKNFSSNPQTASDNFFQHENKNTGPAQIDSAAVKEFYLLKDKLINAGIEVFIKKQDDQLHTPDALFPNNWFSTHADGTLILYPMFAENRRSERRQHIIDDLKKYYRNLVDFTFYEKQNYFLEGTGSLVLDADNKIAYASISKRTGPFVLTEWIRKMKYELISFQSIDKNQQIIYHTNVMMCIADEFAIVCLDAIQNMEEKLKVENKLRETNHQIIAISFDQMHAFCANCLELENKSGEKFLVMSDLAFKNFKDDQLKMISKTCNIIHSDLSTIEIIGGGGARCMMAELY
jgi:hypothetical protein